MEIRQSQLSITNRIFRIAVGAGFIGFTMTFGGHLGYLAVLPLLAVYPVITGLVGEDLIDGLVTNWLGGYQGQCFRPSSRVALIAAGAGAIGMVMANPQSLVSMGWISLASVYPIMAGLFGEDLFSVALSGASFTEQTRVEAHQSVVEIDHREASILHHHYEGENSVNHKIA